MAARRDAEQTKRRPGKNPNEDETAGRIPKELREKLKRTKAAKGLLQDLEEEIRKFVKSWERKEKELEQDGLQDADSDEDDIVFIGRNGRMHDMPPSPKSKRNPKPDENVRKEKLVFNSLANDHGASFG
jgi:hypothetical protein